MKGLPRRPAPLLCSTSSLADNVLLESPCSSSCLDAGRSEADREAAVKVVVRVRPPVQRELQGWRPYKCALQIDDQQQCILLSEGLPLGADGSGGALDGMADAAHRFTFDRVFDPDTDQLEIYQSTAKEAVASVLQGYNASVIAYGQTGTGKTHTMDGSLHGDGRGVVPRAIEDIFESIQQDGAAHSKFLVRASYFQIYCEAISDLLKPGQATLAVREDRRRGTFVEGLSEWVVRSPQEVHQLMERGAANRTTGSTRMNEASSRSHAVFTIIVEKSALADETEVEQFILQSGMPGGAGSAPDVERTVRAGKLNLVDLAGSERVHVTGAVGKQLEESKRINASLSALGNVIAALTDGKCARQHIPYRDSRLTRFLMDSLGGNCRTTLIATVSPAQDAFPETLSTLKFARRAKRIRNQARVNEDADQRTLLRKYERELSQLRRAAADSKQRSDLGRERQLLTLEDQKRRAEADRLAALLALEARSKEILAEKAAKRRLEARIASLQSQLLLGGHKLEETPAFRKMLAKEQARMRSEYEARLRELEREREGGGADRLQRCTQLLAKQREALLALTARLRRRDDQILDLRQELEAFQQHQKHLEDELDCRVAELIGLQRAVAERGEPAVLPALPAPAPPPQAASGPSEVVAAVAPAAGGDAPTEDGGRSCNGDSPAGDGPEGCSEPAEVQGPRADGERLAQLQAECQRLGQERHALRTILEAKIQSLAASIGHALRGAPLKEAGDANLQQALELTVVLENLVAATVQAM